MTTPPTPPPADAAREGDDATLDSPNSLATRISELAARGFRRVNDPRHPQPADAALLREGGARYMSHADDCSMVLWSTGDASDVCTCGLARFRARLRALAEVLERGEQEQQERAASDALLRTAALERLR